MISAPKEEVLGRIVVEWLPSNERTLYQRTNIGGKMVFRVKVPGIGGLYYADAFPAVHVPIPHSEKQPAPFQPVFFVGDRVQIDPLIRTAELKSKQKNYVGFYVEGMEQV